MLTLPPAAVLMAAEVGRRRSMYRLLATLASTAGNWKPFAFVPVLTLPESAVTSMLPPFTVRTKPLATVMFFPAKQRDGTVARFDGAGPLERDVADAGHDVVGRGKIPAGRERHRPAVAGADAR